MYDSNRQIAVYTYARSRAQKNHSTLELKPKTYPDNPFKKFFNISKWFKIKLKKKKKTSSLTWKYLKQLKSFLKTEIKSLRKITYQEKLVNTTITIKQNKNKKERTKLTRWLCLVVHWLPCATEETYIVLWSGNTHTFLGKRPRRTKRWGHLKLMLTYRING